MYRWLRSEKRCNNEERNVLSMKKILSGALAVLAIATTLAVCVSANDGKSLNKSYTYSPVEGVDYTVYYDIGSILPYDDVRGRTKILLYADKGESEGYAIVKLTIKGEVKYPMAVRLPDEEGYVDTDWYECPSVDYAEKVEHNAHAKRNASIYREYTTVNP